MSIKKRADTIKVAYSTSEDQIFIKDMKITKYPASVACSGIGAFALVCADVLACVAIKVSMFCAE